MNQDDFQPITSDKERAQVLGEISAKVKSVAAMTADNQQFGLNLSEVNGSDLLLKVESPSPRAFKNNESMELMIGLPDGFYLLKTAVKAITGSLLMVSFDGALSKLQRRNNFRAPIAASSKITFKLTSFKTVLQKKPHELRPLDLSASGVRLSWMSAEGLPSPAVGDGLAGQMVLPNGRAFEIFGIVKNVLNDSSNLQIGVEFQNLSIRDEQTLLFTCMDLHRRMRTAQ